MRRDIVAQTKTNWQIERDASVMVTLRGTRFDWQIVRPDDITAERDGYFGDDRR